MNFKKLVLAFFITITIFSLPVQAENFRPADAETTSYLNYNLYSYRVRGKWGLYDNKKVLVRPTYDSIETLPGGDYIRVRDGAYYGVLDKWGREIIYPYYSELDSFGNNQFKVRRYGKWGIIDQHGMVDITIKYDDIEYIYDGLYKVKLNSKYGLINNYESELIPIYWDSLERLNSKNVRVSKYGYWGVISKTGKTVLPANYRYIDNVEQNGSNGEMCVCLADDSVCGIINSKGKIILPLSHGGILTKLSDGYFRISKNNRFGVININDENILDCKYTKIEKAADGVIYFKNNKLVGLADQKDGRIIMYPIYTKIEPLKQKGYYKVKKDGKWGVADYEGKVVDSIQYGPLKINSVTKSIPNNQKFIEAYSYNSYYTTLLGVKYKLNIGANVVNDFQKLLSVSNKYVDIKNEALKLIQQYDVDQTYHYNY